MLFRRYGTRLVPARGSSPISQNSLYGTAFCVFGAYFGAVLNCAFASSVLEPSGRPAADKRVVLSFMRGRMGVAGRAAQGLPPAQAGTGERGPHHLPCWR
jgi:hypothetical protein